MKKREFLFRAKKITDNQWVDGGIAIAPDETVIILTKKEQIVWNVIPETVGQFVSKKNNVKIFEGDILKTGMGLGVVIYDNHYSAFMIDFKQHSEKKYFEAFLKFEKVGNIHDNPQLLNTSF